MQSGLGEVFGAEVKDAVHEWRPPYISAMYTAHETKVDAPARVLTGSPDGR